MSRHRKKRRIRGLYHSLKMDADVQYRSSWELEFYRYLDNFEDVSKFYVESLKIPYVYRKKVRNYRPDVLIEYCDGRPAKLVEIKPKSFMHRRVNIAKFEAARIYCFERGIQFEVMTEESLKSLGLLVR